MASTLKILNNNPVKFIFSSINTWNCSPSIFRRHSVIGKSGLIKTWIKQHEPKLHHPFSMFKPIKSTRKVPLSGGNASSIGRGLLGVSFMIGSIAYHNQVAYAMDGQDILVDDSDFSDESSDVGKEFPLIWIFVRKLWLPTFFFLTVLVNWDHPIVLVTKVVLFLFSTKPSPLSVYVFIGQLCQQSMREKPYLYLLKSLYANKVEVQDYKLFCLATVEVKDQKLTLVGVLGGWWAFPLSQKAFSVFWNSVLY